MKRFTSLFVIALIGALIIATGVSALVVNGDFENGTFGSWTKTAYVNNGYSSALGGGGADLSAIVGGPAVAPLSLSDSRSNNALRYPAYGHYSARVNNEQSYSSGGYSRNGNMITQNVSAYIDPADSLNHTKFAYAAVMVNPASGHTDDQKPYFRVRAINVSNGNDVLYDFASYVNEPGKNWQDGAAFGGGEFWKYLNWQVIDLTSSPVHPVNSGDNIRIEVSASGCSLGGHPGYVYVDEITDNEIAGPTVRATGPSGADQGSTITYTYNYKNGSAGSIDPTVTATQPTGVTFTSVTDPNCSLSGGTVTCNFTNVPAGGSGSFTVNGTVTASTGFQIAHGAYSIAAPGFPTVGGQTVLTTVTSVGTSTTVGSSVNPSVSGQSVTFTATVAPTSGSNTPTGTVQFSIDGSPVGSPVALSGGTASFTTSSLSVGNHPVGVSYGGNPGFNPSSGSLAGGQTVNKANSATVVSTSPNPSDFGQTVTLTANISAAAPGSDVPSGTVQFAIDGSNFGSPVAVSGSGIAQLTTSAMAVGAHNIGASYNGNANFNSSSGSTTHQVDNADSTTSVVSSLPTSTYGQSVTFTATVTVDPPGVGTPGGTVSFFDGATPIPGCQNLPLNGSGQAQCSTANLTGGFHNISVVYSGNGSFNGGSGNVTQNVNKATLGVTASSHTVTYGDAVPAVTPSYTGFVLSQGPGDLTAQPSCTTSYTQSSSAAGSPYSTSCSGGVSGNYDFAPTNGTVTVNKAALTVTASSHTVTFGDAAPTVTPSYSGFVLSQGPANLTTAPTCSTTYTAGSTAANSPYSSSCGGGVSDNYSFSYTGGTVAVDKAMLTVTASSHAVTFGDAAPNVTPAYSGFVLSQGPANLATAPTCSTTYTAGSTAANSPYTSSCGGGVSDNYSFTYTGGTVAVDKAILTVTASSHTVTFGDAAPTVTPSYSGFVLSQGPANLSTAPTCSTTYAAGSTAANSPYPTACVGGVSSNYSFSYTNGSVTVGKATLTVTASSHTVFYGSLVPTITPSYAGFVLGQNAASLVTRPTCSTTYLYGTGVADPLSSTTCSGGVSPNYAFVYVNGAVTVTKTNTATYVATLINPPVYGQTLTATATITAVAPGGGTPQGTVSFFDGATPIVGCQDVPVTPLGAATCSSNTLAAGVNKSISAQYSGNSNYNPSNGATTQTIGKATLNVTASSHTVTYGDAAPSITSTITGFALGETIVNITPPTCSTTYAQGSPVSGSQYPATCSGAVSANYNFNYAGGYVTVNKKALTVTADNKLRTYGAANPPFTATIAGFVLGQNQGTSDLTGSPLLTTTATSSSSVNGGPYTITASLGTLNSGNYSFNFINGQLTIDKAVLTITANNASRVFGSPNPAFSGSYSGFVNGESLPTSGTTGTPSLTTAAVQTSPVGTYDIVVGSGNLAAANYSFAFVNGTLTVNKAPTITTITNAAAIAAGSSRVGQGFDVNWTSVPESPITGTLTGNVVVSDGSGATCTAPVAAGTCSLVSTSPGIKAVVATYQGDNNFLSSNSMGVFHTVVILIAGNVKLQASPAPNINLPGVTVRITGSTTGETITDANGNYSFSTTISGGNFTVTPSGLGYTYVPADRSYTNVLDNVLNADFLAVGGPVIVPTPTPNATPTPGVTPTPAVTPTPVATPTPNPTPTGSPTPTPSGMGGEGDVVDAAGATLGGDGVHGNDLDSVREFALKNSQADINAMQFQRGDTAPRDPSSGTYGDGAIDSSDVTVVRLYSMGLLPDTSAAGPVVPDAAPTPPVMPDDPRVIRAVNVGTRPGEVVTVQFEMVAQGDEASESFTIHFDQSVLSNPVVMVGGGVSQGTHLGTNTKELGLGKIGILLDSVTAHTPGARQILTVRFNVAADAQIGLYPVSFEDSTTVRSVSSTIGRLLPTRYQTGYVQIGSTAAGVTMSGRVTTAGGQGLRNATVVMTDQQGYRRTTTTGSFGFYRFDDVESGRTYIVGVSAKRYRFNPRVVDLTDSLTDVDFIGNE